MEYKTKKSQMGLIPLRNFGILDEVKGLYRSAQPMYPYEYQWLKEVLGLKKIINLREESNRDFLIAPTYNIKVVNFKVHDHKEPDMALAKRFMAFIRNEENYPALIHCEHGHGRTSTFCVLARVAMGWDIHAAIREEEERFHYSFKHPAQKEFLIKNFSNGIS